MLSFVYTSHSNSSLHLFYVLFFVHFCFFCLALIDNLPVLLAEEEKAAAEETLLDERYFFVFVMFMKKSREGEGLAYD